MKGRRLMVVDLRAIEPVDGVPQHDKSYNYHGGGPLYRGYSKLDPVRIYGKNPLRSVPTWARTEMMEHIKLITEHNAIRRMITTEKNEAKMSRLSRKFGKQQDEMELIRKRLREKLGQGKFKSPYGTITEEDLFNAAIHSFADGVLSPTTAYLKDEGIKSRANREKAQIIAELGNRRDYLSRLFGKPFSQITPEELKSKIGKGQVFENDLFYLKAIKQELTKKDLIEAKKKGIVVRLDREYAKMLNENDSDSLVYTSKGVSQFSTSGILVEAERADWDYGPGHFPMYAATLPSRSIRTIYIHGDELQGGVKDEKLEKDIAARINTFNEARRIAEEHGEKLAKGDVDALAKELRTDKRLIALAKKIASDHPEFKLENYKTKIPANEI